ncbi:ATP-binding cassette sub-family A member 3, partial [Stegodyphus mimosarum]
MQLRGLLMKRFHHARRNWSILVAQFILPIMCMVVCFCTIPNKPSLSAYFYSPLKLSIKNVYGRTDGFYTADEDQIRKHLKNVFEENYISARSTNKPNNYIMEYGTKSFIRYQRKFLIGSSIENVNDSLILTAWYNDKACHSAPMSLLLSHTAILRYVSGTGYIHLTNAPLPGGSAYLRHDPERARERNMIGIFVPLAFAFLSASFVLLPIQERTSKA